MKKIVYFAIGLLCSLGVFTACSDDRDDNPTLQVPTQFVLNARISNKRHVRPRQLIDSRVHMHTT